MKTAKVLSVIWVAIFSSSVCFSQNTSAPPQLIELIKKAMDNYPKLKEGNEYVKLSETQHDLAKAIYMPVIEGDASYRYGKPTPSIDFPINGHPVTIQFVPANNYDFHLALTQPITDFGRSQVNVKKALSEIQTSKDNVEGAKQTLAYQVAQIYYTIVFLNKSVDVQNDQIKLLSANEKIITDKLKDGDALKFDLLSTQVKKNNAQNVLIDLQTNIQKQYELLNMLTAGNGEGYILQKDVNSNEVSNGEVKADNNYDIISGNDKLKSFELGIKSARFGWMPVLLAQGRLGYQNGYVPDINKLLFTYSAGVSLSIPIFNSSRPNYITKIAKINMQAANYNLETQKLNLEAGILQSKSDIESSDGKLRNYELQVDQAKEALKLADIRYRNGIITNLELLTAQTDLQNAQLGKIQLQYNQLLAKLQLNKLGGTKFW